MNIKFNKIFFLLMISVFLFGLSFDVFAATLNVGPGQTYSTIQSAINAAVSGVDSINVEAGTYAETLNLGDKSLDIEGAGIDATTVDASSKTGYAIQNLGDSSTIRGLTLIGTGSSSSSYGFKVTHVNNIILENIKVENSYKTGIDLNTVTGATLNNIEVDNTVNGFGLMILDSNDVTVTDVTTSGNAWGGVSVQTKNANTDNVQFSGDFNVGESAPLLLEQDPDPDTGEYYEITNTPTPSKFQYIVYDLREKQNSPEKYENYKQRYYFKTLDEAKTVAQSFVSSTTYTYLDTIVYDRAEENYYVIEGMKIQDAIDAANPGTTINVNAGTYNEQININKPLTLQGAGMTNTNIVSPNPTTMTIYDAFGSKSSTPRYDGHRGTNIPVVRITASDVTFKGFNVDMNNQQFWDIKGSYPVDTTYSRGVGILVDHVETTPETPDVFTNIKIQNNKVTGMLQNDKGDAIKVLGSATALIEGNTIYAYGESGINAQAIDSPRAVFYPTVTANDNTIYGGNIPRDSTHYFFGIGYWSGATGTSNGNTIYNSPNDNGYALNVWGPRPISFTNNIITTDGGSVGGYGAQLYESSNLIFSNNNIEKQGLVGAIWLNPIITINGNTISNSVDGFIVDHQTSGSVAMNLNKITGISSGHYAVKVGGTKDTNSGTIWGTWSGESTVGVNAENNYWGSAVKATVQSKLSGNINFEPYYIDAGMTILNTEKPSIENILIEPLHPNLGSEFIKVYAMITDSGNDLDYANLIYKIEGDPTIYTEEFTGPFLGGYAGIVNGNPKDGVKVTYKVYALDTLGNEQVSSESYFIYDGSAPTITVPTVLATEATSSSGAVVTYTAPSATDVVDVTDVVTCDHNSGDPFSLGDTFVTCNSVDAAGNHATPSVFTITVQDKTAPVISGTPPEITTEATGSSGVVVNYDLPTATDLVDGSVSVLCLPLSGSTFPLGITTVTCTATDAASNIATPSVFTITVQDKTAPVITITNPNTFPAQSKTITANGGDGTLTMSITTGSTCDGTLPFTAYADTTFSAEADNGKKVCYKSVDVADNVAYSMSNTIAGIDTTAPTMTELTATVDSIDMISTEGTLTVAQGSLTSSIKVELSEAVTLGSEPKVTISISGIDYDYGTIALDSVDNKILIITPIGSNGIAGLLGSFTFTFAAGSVKDVANNENVLTTFTLIVTDQTAPTATVSYSIETPTNQDVTATITPSEGVTITSEGGLTHTFLSNGNFIFEFIDAAGNTGTATATVSNIDKVIPEITITNPDSTPAQTKTITALMNEDGILSMFINAGDVCDETLTFTAYADTTFSSESDNGKTVCYTAVDLAGNVVYKLSNAIAGIDTKALIESITYSTTGWTNHDVTATLNPSETITITNNEGLATHTFSENGGFTFNFVDLAGNTGTATATVSNIDKAAPIITINAYNTAPTNQNILVTASTDDGTLNAENHLFTENDAFTFTATDAAGNTRSETVTITNIDKIVPTIEDTGPITEQNTKEVTIYVTTNEETICRYASGQIPFLRMNLLGREEPELIHTMTLNLIDDDYDYFVRCRDKANNEVTTWIHFDVDTTRDYATTINLNANWNSFTLPQFLLNQWGYTTPESRSPSTILASLDGNYEIVWYYNGATWLHYDPNAEPYENSLIEFNDPSGTNDYWIKMINPDRLEIPYYT